MSDTDSPVTPPEPQPADRQTYAPARSGNDEGEKPAANEVPAAPRPPSNAPAPSDVPSEPAAPEVSLDLLVVDSVGRCVPGLNLRVMRYGEAGKVQVVDATTDAKGAIEPITTLSIGTRFEVQIKNDRGVYKMAAIGTVQSQRMTGNLTLPHQRFEFATYSHDGPAGSAEKAKQSTAAKHTQQADGKIDIARNGVTAPTVKLDRTEAGNPKAIVGAGGVNMLGQNRMSASNPNLALSAPEKVKALIEFGMEQLTWTHPKTLVSDVIIKQMKASTYTHESRPQALGYAKSIGRCAKYVKIALWKAGYIPTDGDFDPGTSPASKLGPGLLRAGFTDVTASLPDARWAAPGDVIVYRKIGAPDADGHIDIRTYDGYLSDFWDSYLPVTQFEVIGIYRKYFDPLPEKRMRAFLKTIRSREAETLFKLHGDAATYKALPYNGRKGEAPPQFSSFDSHPFINSEEKRNASGAYGILKSSYKLYTDMRYANGKSAWVDVSALKEKFSPTVQDRIAVAIMELHPGQGYGTAPFQTIKATSLTLVRTDKITEAVSQLAVGAKAQWTSLPGGVESKDKMDAFMSDYQTFYNE